MRRKPNARDRYELFVDPGALQFKRRRGRPWDLPPPAKCYGFPDQVKAYYQDAWFLSDFELAFEEFFDRVFYLGPLREYPRREYTWAGGQPEDVGRRGERAVDALLAARERGLMISRGKGRPRWSLEEYVAWWLRELGLIHAFSVEPVAEGSTLYRVRVQQTPDAPMVLLTDVGFGVSQILPVLVLCYYVPEGSTILLEQPEIHLHPRVQAGLADVLIDAIKVRKIQIVVESHSEHLLLRLQRRIAEQEKGFTNAHTALYFCDVQDGSSRLLPLDLDEYGNIRNWPKGFFGDAFEETAAMTRAAMERKRRAAA
jgi:predicted ATPase